MTAADDGFVSTGRLPTPDVVQAAIDEVHRDVRRNDDGRLSTTYPALSAADPGRFGICVAGVGGRRYEVGDTRYPFPIMSAVKPFVFALAAERLGLGRVIDAVGADATGQAFNSVGPVESSPSGRTNPMVNSGAIVTVSLLAEALGDSVWPWLLEQVSQFAGRQLALDEAVYESASGSNSRNRALAYLLADRGALACEPGEAVELYTRQSSLQVTACDLAVMGATLADAGTNPMTGSVVVGPEVAASTLAVMATAGMYETSGRWLVEVGLPAKSGIGGGIVTAAPGKGGMGTYSPLLDAAGNSVRGSLAARLLSARLGLDVFLTRPERDAADTIDAHTVARGSGQ